MAQVPAPKSLEAAGKALWGKITGAYELRPDELETLEDACRITDAIAAIERAWSDDGRPMTTRGSMGQLVMHPFVGELRVQRMARNALWRQLRLPDDAGVVVPNQARDAAKASWQPTAARRRGA